MLHPGPPLTAAAGSDPVAAIEAAKVAYLEAYLRLWAVAARFSRWRGSYTVVLR
jgi:hypothetical protein